MRVRVWMCARMRVCVPKGISTVPKGIEAVSTVCVCVCICMYAR